MESFTLSGRALLPDGRFAESTLRIGAGCITHLAPGADPAADLLVDGWIVPGFIDLQLNGAYGLDFTTDGGTVAPVAARLPSTGTTAFLPTIITSPPDLYPRRLAEVAQAIPEVTGAQVLGVHLEGPYFNPIRKGAHNQALLRAVNVDEIVRWAGHPLVRLVTLAPELPSALDAIQALVRRGIVVSAGHSNATYAEAQAGFAAGLGWGTHLFNAMRELTHREPGLTGALLTTNIPCGVIADGIHVHPAMLNLAYRAKGSRGLTLVTDAMAAMGMPPGRYLLADQNVQVDETSARLSEGTLAGSILTMDQAVRNMLDFTGCSLAEAVTMGTLTPARVLRLGNKGRLAPGCDADVVILDGALRVTWTWVQGQAVFEPAHTAKASQAEA